MNLCKRALVALASACLFMPLTAQATNGYFLHGFGKNKALAGSGIANPQDALSLAHSPAGHVWLDGDQRFDITGEFLIPDMEYQFRGMEPVESNQDMFGLFKGYFLIPAMAYSNKIDERNSFAFAMYGAGFGSDYREEDTIIIDVGETAIPIEASDGSIITLGPGQINGTFFDGRTGMFLLLLELNFSWAHKFSDTFSAGVGFIVAGQMLNLDGVGLFGLASVDPSAVSNNGNDWAFGGGIQFGAQWQVMDEVTLGISYDSEISLVHKEYGGLLAGSGALNKPQTATVGVAFHTSDTSVLTMDVQWIDWSGVAAIGNEFEQFGLSIEDINNNNFNALGSSSTPAFGWDDTLILKIGYQWKFQELPKWIWRVGYSTKNQQIRSSQALFNILAPATTREHFTAGFTWDFTEGAEFTFNYFYGPEAVVEGSGFSGIVDHISLEIQGLELGLGIKW